MGGFYDDKWTL